MWADDGAATAPLKRKDRERCRGAALLQAFDDAGFTAITVRGSFNRSMKRRFAVHTDGKADSSQPGFPGAAELFIRGEFVGERVPYALVPQDGVIELWMWRRPCRPRSKSGVMTDVKAAFQSHADFSVNDGTCHTPTYHSSPPILLSTFSRRQAWNSLAGTLRNFRFNLHQACDRALARLR